MREKFFNIAIDNITMQECIEKINSMIERGGNHYIVTPNVDHIVKLQKDMEFLKVYENADLIVADGMPLIWYSKLIKKPLKEKISGSDLFPEVCKNSVKNGQSIFLLGAAEGVAEKAKKNLEKKYDGIKILGTYAPKYGFEKDEKEIENIINCINTVKPDILAVGLGAPKQEKFICKYKDRLQVAVTLAIGATIDFEAGAVKRAPKWMQKMGIEWFYRLIQEPKRMYKRYLVEDRIFLKIALTDYKNRKQKV